MDESYLEKHHSDLVQEKDRRIYGWERGLNLEWERKYEGREVGFKREMVDLESRDDVMESLQTEFTICDCDSGYTESLLDALDGLGDLKAPYVQEEPSNVRCSTLDVDVELSDVQILLSIMLAEEAAYNGKDDFKTVEKLDDLVSRRLLLYLVRIRILKSQFLSGISDFTKQLLEKWIQKESQTYRIPQ